ncbi:tetratricopeptide repeat protein [Pelomyxa schiedti]|nr:tetratricopeptide repeat protein [Pelomyxa schiedti]
MAGPGPIKGRVKELRRRRHYTEAIGIVDQTLTRSPNDASMCHCKALLLTDLGRHDDALAWYDRALELRPGDIGTLRNKIVALSLANKFTECVGLCDQVLIMAPGDPAVLNNKGNALRKEGRPAEALDCFNHSLAVMPNSAITFSNKAHALCDMSRYSESIEWYNRALELNPNDMLSVEFKAGALLFCNRFAEAVECYNTVITSRSSEDATLLCMKGIALGRGGNTTEGTRLIKRAHALEQSEVTISGIAETELWAGRQSTSPTAPPTSASGPLAALSVTTAPSTASPFANFTVHQVKLFTVKEVTVLLEQIGLGAHSKAFEENEITGVALLELSDDDLKNELGITKLGPRRTLLSFIKECLKNT